MFRFIIGDVQNFYIFLFLTCGSKKSRTLTNNLNVRIQKQLRTEEFGQYSTFDAKFEVVHNNEKHSDSLLVTYVN